MTFLEMTQARYSVRKFAATPIEPEKIQTILAAVRNAPTAHNNQPQKIFVVQSTEGIASIDKCSRGRYNAPVVFVLGYDKSLSWKRKDGYDAGEVDCGILGTHILFAAHEMGLGSCWIALFHPEILKELFQLPDSYVPVALIPMGYIAADAVPFEFHFQRKPLSETVEFK